MAPGETGRHPFTALHHSAQATSGWPALTSIGEYGRVNMAFQLCSKKREGETIRRGTGRGRIKDSSVSKGKACWVDRRAGRPWQAAQAAGGGVAALTSRSLIWPAVSEASLMSLYSAWKSRATGRKEGAVTQEWQATKGDQVAAAACARTSSTSQAGSACAHAGARAADGWCPLDSPPCPPPIPPACTLVVPRSRSSTWRPRSRWPLQAAGRGWGRRPWQSAGRTSVL